VDFFLCIVWFLLYFFVVFYVDEQAFLVRITWYYLAANAVLLILFVFRLGSLIQSAFRYGVDVIMLLLILALWLYIRLDVRSDHQRVKKLRTSTIVCVVVPLILVPIFKYALLVPLPYEGGIIGIMNLIRYGF
jgi:hypothetical protein